VRSPLVVLFSLAAVAVTGAGAEAAILEVCASGCDYTAIQSAMDAATSGDIVLVHPGAYVENVVTRGGVTLRSLAGPEVTTIDGGGLGSVVTMASGTLEGFTITNGDASMGGGINHDYYVSTTIRSCIVTGNNGSGISLGIEGADAIIVDSTVYGNSGSAVSVGFNSSLTMTNCVLSGNGTGVSCGGESAYLTASGCTFTGNEGTGIDIGWCWAELTNCTIAGNAGYGVHSVAGGGALLQDTTVARNLAGAALGYVDNIDARNSIIMGQFGSATFGSVTYSDVDGGWPGEGNIDADPLFVDPMPPEAAPTSAGDYHLLAGSPCIDTGTAEGAPLVDVDCEVRPWGAGFDMGSDEVGSIPALIFADGFNSGDTSAWSVTVP